MALGQDYTKIDDAKDLPLIPLKMTASGIVFNGPCVLRGFKIFTDKTNPLRAEFYDDTVADPNWLDGLEIVGSDLSGGNWAPGIIRVRTLLRLVITGTIGTGYVGVFYNDYDPS